MRCILVRSVGRGFCAGGTPEVLQGMLNNEADRMRVMREEREERDIVQGMMDCDLPIVSAINGAAVGAGARPSSRPSKAITLRYPTATQVAPFDFLTLLN